VRDKYFGMMLIIFFSISNITGYSQNHFESLKRIGKYSDTTKFYYQYSTPFSFVFKANANDNIRIDFWSLIKGKNNKDLQSKLLDTYKFNMIESGKFLYLWDRENKVKYKGSILFLLYNNNTLENYVKFIQN
jgi:hypothetical protein